MGEEVEIDIDFQGVGNVCSPCCYVENDDDDHRTSTSNQSIAIDVLFDHAFSFLILPNCCLGYRKLSKFCKIYWSIMTTTTTVKQFQPNSNKNYENSFFFLNTPCSWLVSLSCYLNNHNIATINFLISTQNHLDISI